MASLPSNTFMFNYNAKEYNPTTHTFPKTSGQLFDEDLVLNKAVASYTSDYVNFGSSKAYMTKGYNSTAENPFNRSNSEPFTLIYKVSGFTSHTENLLSNRDKWNGFNGLNYSIRGDAIVNSIEYCLRMTATTNPCIIVIRIDPTNSIYERKVVDVSGNTLQSVTASTITWGQTSQGIGFFVGGYGAAANYEWFTKTFYWMYLSKEGLSDSEVLKVIRYNEGVGMTVDPDSINFDATGGTGTIDISSENPWTASTTDNWISISPLTGSSDATVTISAPYNSFDQRTGTVTFTDGDDSVDLTVIQKENTLIPFKKMYKNGNRIN